MGYLRMGRETRKSKKHLSDKIFVGNGKCRKIWWLAQSDLLQTPLCSNFLAPAASSGCVRRAPG
jgi:hypothetical protein